MLEKLPLENTDESKIVTSEPSPSQENINKTDVVDEINNHVYNGKIEGKVYTLEEIQKQELEDAQEKQMDEDNLAFIEECESFQRKFEEKNIIEGEIVSKSDRYIVVDIGAKSEGVISSNEFSNEEFNKLAVHDKINVFLDRLEDKRGQLLISQKKAELCYAWEKIEHCYNTQEIIEGHIKSRIKGGMIVDIMGIDAFLPGSQIEMEPVQDFDLYVGKTMEFKVVKYNTKADNIVVSHRAILELDNAEQRQLAIDQITPGEVMVGYVKNITDFGVFVSLNGVDGLIYITDLAWGRITHPTEIIQLNQKVTVSVTDISNEANSRISLSCKALRPHPWDNIEEKYSIGLKVQGRVVSITDYGVFAEIEKGVEGLIHISEISWATLNVPIHEWTKKEEVIECVILDINKDLQKISLGVKQLKPDPWKDIEIKYPIDSKQQATIISITNYGIFIELEEGVRGFVHISDMDWLPIRKDLEELYKINTKIDVVILKIDYETRRMNMGIKQLEPNPWELFIEKYPLNAEITGTVKRISKKNRGYVVQLPFKNLTGFLHNNLIKKEKVVDENITEEQDETDKTKKPKLVKPSWKEGDEITAKVMYVDVERSSIILSQVPEKKADSMYIKRTLTKEDRLTLGDVVSLDAKTIEGEIKEDKKVKASKKDEMDKETKKVKTSKKDEMDEETEKPKAKPKAKVKSKEKNVLEKEDKLDEKDTSLVSSSKKAEKEKDK